MQVNSQVANVDYANYSAAYGEKKTQSTLDSFLQLKEEFVDEYESAQDDTDSEDDWRTMSDEQWDKLVENIDNYIEDYKEDLEERRKLQNEAIMKEAANTPAYMKTNALSNAALAAVNHGTTEVSEAYEEAYDETAESEKAQAGDRLSKSQELALTGETTTGINKTSDSRECATVAEDENKDKVWTITAFTEQGITCTQSKNGVSTKLWSIDYQNADDYQRVWDYLDGLDEDADNSFISDKSFWEDFLSTDSATKEDSSSDNGKRIGLITVGDIVYIASYANNSTPENPIVKIGDYEVSINDVNPEDATGLEMCALLSYLDDTNQTNNKGMSSFGKLRAYADLAERNGICEGINDAASIGSKKQNWTDIISSVKQIFLKNKETYKQAINCDNLLLAMAS